VTVCGVRGASVRGALSENHYDQTIQEIRDALSQMGRLTHADSSSHVGVES
jgi:hypothetical protein